MGGENWVQCGQCGHLHRVKKVLISDDDLYTKPIWCSKCRDGTKHLLIGEHEEDVYLYGDTFLDQRYFKYNTK